MRIDLWNMHGDFFAALVPEKTGVVWSNQTAGLACAHPEIEGFLFPLPADCKPHRKTDPFENVGYGDDPYEPASVTAWLVHFGIDMWFCPLSVEEFEASGLPFHEAWIPVKIIAHNPHGPNLAAGLEQLTGRVAVLTYNNSD